MIFLKKNDDNVAKNKENGNERLPYFSLYLVPEEDGGKWVEIGAFWKSKSGKGYSGNFSKGFEFSAAGVKPYKKNEEGD